MESLEVTTTIDVDPKMLAVLFWSMGSIEQAAFFKHLAEEIAVTYRDQMEDYAKRQKGIGFCGPDGEGQWWHLHRELSAPEHVPGEPALADESKDGRAVLMAMAAPFYLNILRNAGQL